MEAFWKNKRVLVTGHTGFKGSWLCLWLNALGARVAGFALEPPTGPSLYELARVDQLVKSVIADIRDYQALKRMIDRTRPEIIFHLAAQPIVRESYKVPVETFSVNVMGTVNLLEAARRYASVRSIVNVTTDKVYEAGNGNRVMRNAYKESDPLGGYDPYSSSKACSELVTQSYRRSYGLPVATARAGNVIGGGDWASDRLIPDFVRSILKKEKIVIRDLRAVRPWQHVLEPLNGYLMLARALYQKGDDYAEAWNFGPDRSDAKTVEWVVSHLCSKWGEGAAFSIDKRRQPHEAFYLMLDNAKAKARLGWRPKRRLDRALDEIIAWNRAYLSGADMRRVCLDEIRDYDG